VTTHTNTQADYSRRSAQDLIAELNAEKDKFFTAALAVGFESSTTFVFGNDVGQLEKLIQAMAAGGEPIGLIGIVKEPREASNGEHISFYSRPLSEYETEPWAREYLNALASTVAELLRLRELRAKEGWLQ